MTGGDSRCLVCRGSGLAEAGVPCACAEHAPRDLYAPPSAGWAGEALRALLARAEAGERHRVTCTDRPCDQCERHVCPCGKPFDGPYRRCSDCRSRHRSAEALARVISSVPTRFQWAVDATIAGLARRVRLAPERIANALGDRLPAGDLLLVGDTAAGKTSLVVAMLAARVRSDPEAWRAALFATAYGLAGARARWPLGQGEPPNVIDAMQASLLVVDDLGSEVDDRRNVLADVIFARHNEDRPTWITTGFSTEHLAQRYGTAVVRRILESGKRVELGR